MSLIISEFAHSQSSIDYKRDYQWLTGYFIPNNNPVNGGTLWDFNNTSSLTVTPFSLPDYTLIWSNSVIADTSGSFLFSTNGVRILGKNHQIIPGGDSLSFGYWEVGLGHNQHIIHGVIIMPLPGDDSTYYVFHERIDTLPGGIINYKPLELLYSVIQITPDDTNGTVITKNNRIITDTLSFGFETIRHANGRDWWLIMPAHYDNKFYTILFTPTGIQSVRVQYLQSPYSYIFPHTDQVTTTISQDGSTFFIASFQADDWGNPWTGGTVPLRVIHFDRCNGTLYDERDFSETVDGAPILSSCLSPNSRYLYIAYTINPGLPTRTARIYQYDLTIPDFGQSRQLIGEYDGYYDSATCVPNRPMFQGMKIGPDNRIYIQGCNTRWIHVINQPDLPGDSCDFHQRGLLLPTFALYSLPHFPNYRLGPLPGTICDSLSIGLPESKTDHPKMTVYPNPASDQLFVHMKDTRTTDVFTWQITDITGREVACYMKSDVEFTIDVSLFSEGVYYLSVFIPETGCFAKKFVIAR